MQPVELMKDLFFFERGYLNGNHFAFVDDRSILIDTAYIKDFDDTRALLESSGVDLGSVDTIVNTHCHCDHIGGNKFIQDASGCSVVLHPIGRHFIDTRDDWSTWSRYYDQDAEFFRTTGSISDGDVLAVGPHQFQVIYTPGHAAEGIVLYNRKERVLISSDTLWERDMPVVTERIEGSRAVFSLLESLERIEKLKVDIVYPGHGRPFSDMTAAVERARERLLGYLENRKRIGNDLLKKIIVYTLMMRERIPADAFFDRLMKSRWFPETVDFYFSGEYRKKYDDVMGNLLKRTVVKEENGNFVTTVKP